MIFIETAQINLLQTFQSENFSLPTVDKEAFLQNLESFLEQQTEGEGAENLEEIAAESLLKGETVDGEQEEIETSELFSHVAIPFIQPVEKMVVSEQTEEKNILPKEFVEETSEATQSSLIQADSIKLTVFNESREFSEAMDTQDLTQTDVEKHPISEVKSSVHPEIQSSEVAVKSQVETEILLPDSVTMQSEGKIESSEELFTEKPQLSNGSKVSELILENKEDVTSNTKRDPRVVHETAAVEPQKTDVNEKKEQVTASNFFQEPVPISKEERVIQTIGQLEPVSVKSTQNISHEIESTSNEEVVAQPMTNEISTAPQTASIKNQAEAAPLSISQEEWAAKVEEIVLEQARTSEGKSVTKTHLQLTPEHLGKMEVELTIENRELVVKIAVEQSETKQWLEKQLPTLTKQLAAQEITMTAVQIDMAPTLSNPFNFSQHQQASQEKNHFERKQWKKKGALKEAAEEQEVSPNTINSARGLSLWA